MNIITVYKRLSLEVTAVWRISVQSFALSSSALQRAAYVMGGHPGVLWEKPIVRSDPLSRFLMKNQQDCVGVSTADKPW